MFDFKQLIGHQSLSYRTKGNKNIAEQNKVDTLFKIFFHRYNQEFSQESPRRNSKIVISGKIPTRPG